MDDRTWNKLLKIVKKKKKHVVGAAVVALAAGVIGYIFSKKYLDISIKFKVPEQGPQHQAELREKGAHPKLRYPILPIKRKPQVAAYNTSELILIRDPVELKRKITKMQKDGLSELQIVSDFDMTISPVHIGDLKCSSTFGIFRATEYTSSTYKDKTTAEFTKYHPIETDPSIPHEDKRLYMREWLENCETFLKEEGVTYDTAVKILEEGVLGVRNGFPEFIQLCKKHNLPFFIISGGVLDYISTILNHFVDVNHYDNLEIFSNQMRYDKYHKGFIGFERPIVHSNDKEFVLDHTKREFKKNVLLMGDLKSDFVMAKNMNYEEIIAINFYNEKEISEDTKKQLMECYDVVITRDGNYGYCESLLKQIAGYSQNQEGIYSV
jgi:5'-nucleotidase